MLFNYSIQYGCIIRYETIKWNYEDSIIHIVGSGCIKVYNGFLGGGESSLFSFVKLSIVFDILNQHISILIIVLMIFYFQYVKICN